MNRQQKTWCALPIVVLGFGLSMFAMAASESCMAEVGKGAVCGVDWMKLPDDYASSS